MRSLARRSARAIALAIGLLPVAAAPRVARAEGQLRLAPGFALPVSTHGDLLAGNLAPIDWGPGASLAVEAELVTGRGAIALHAIALPTLLGGDNGAGPTTILAGGLGVRLQRPHRARGLAPWISVDALAAGVSTGAAHDLGVAGAAALGLDVPLRVGGTRRLWLGPSVRVVYCARFDPYVDDVFMLVVGIGVAYDVADGT